jgi:hypothetical protein
MYVQPMQLWCNNQQINQLAHLTPYTGWQAPSTAVVFDHARIIIHRFNINDIIPDPQQIPLRKVIQELIRPIRRKVICSAPAVPKVDRIERHINHKCVISI